MAQAVDMLWQHGNCGTNDGKNHRRAIDAIGPSQTRYPIKG